MKPITFLQWNVLYTEDVRNIVKLLKELKPDIIALQELTANLDLHKGINVPEVIAKELGYNYFAKLSSVPTDPSAIEMGSGIFTRFPVVSSRFEWINEYDKSVALGYDNQYKAYVEATIQVDSSNLTVGTTHMSYTHRFINYPRKRQETDKLIKILDQNKSNFIFSGDLNSRPNSYTVKVITKRLKHAGPRFEKKTWTTKPFSYRGFIETKLNWRLDYVFTTKDIEVISSEIISTSYSDHLPILTTFNLLEL